MSGWRVFRLLAAAETAIFAVALWQFGTDEAGLRALVRLTVRVSFLVFAVVCAAAPLHRLYPALATRWLLRNRRDLGVSFAWAHGLHGVAIARLGGYLAGIPAVRRPHLGLVGLRLAALRARRSGAEPVPDPA